MPLTNLNLTPTNRQLRQFGAISVVAIPLITWFWTRNTSITINAAVIGVAIGAIAAVLPRVIKPVFIGLTILTFPIGLVMGELAMLLIYFGLFVPMSVIFRLIKRDSLQRRTAPQADSFWQQRSSNIKISRYYQQF